MSFLKSFAGAVSPAYMMFGRQKSPADRAMKYQEQIPGIAHETYDPYIQRGNESSNTALNEYNRMASDPSYMDTILKNNYTPSHGFNLRKDEAMKAMRNSSAAGGFTGTYADQMRQGELASSLAGQDMNEWWDRYRDTQNTGLQGLSHYGDVGYDASNQMGGALMDNMDTMGSLAYDKQMQNNKRRTDRGKFIMDVAGSAFGVPGAGGMIGGAMGGGGGGGMGPGTIMNGAPGGQYGQQAPRGAGNPFFNPRRW